MNEERTLDEALEEMDKWGDSVSLNLESLTPEEIAEYFKKSQGKLQKLIGKPLDLPTVAPSQKSAV
jgi:hypothetical protein